jgi:hypothetical protein
MQVFIVSLPQLCARISAVIFLSATSSMFPSAFVSKNDISITSPIFRKNFRLSQLFFTAFYNKNYFDTTIRSQMVKRFSKERIYTIDIRNANGFMIKSKKKIQETILNAKSRS